MRLIALSLAKAAGWISRALGLGGGTTIPGMILLKLRPHALQEMAQELEEIIVISATNGKTTTARMVSHAARCSIRTVKLLKLSVLRKLLRLKQLKWQQMKCHSN